MGPTHLLYYSLFPFKKGKRFFLKFSHFLQCPVSPFYIFQFIPLLIDQRQSAISLRDWLIMWATPSFHHIFQTYLIVKFKILSKKSWPENTMRLSLDWLGTRKLIIISPMQKKKKNKKNVGTFPLIFYLWSWFSCYFFSLPLRLNCFWLNLHAGNRFPKKS